jgi:hypothetical protein
MFVPTARHIPPYLDYSLRLGLANLSLGLSWSQGLLSSWDYSNCIPFSVSWGMYLDENCR